MAITAHEGYRIIWATLHAVGGAGAHVYLSRTGDVDGFVVYWIAFLALELVGLARVWAKGRDASATFTWSVWDFLDDGTGFAGVWRLVFVGAWSVWLVATFAVLAPLPAFVRAPFAFLFGMALWAHFFGGHDLIQFWRVDKRRDP